MSRPRLLITNDDGIDSYFLKALVEAHLPFFEVRVAVPAYEQSWIGRAVTREGSVTVREDERFGCPCWTFTGTPTDCVNIALGHLIPQEEHPEAVISGINIGHNTAFPFILSSGTIGGALEGLMWGMSAIAYSHRVPAGSYEILRANRGEATGALRESLTHAANRAVGLTQELMQAPQSGLCVHNINFPENTTATSPIEQTIPERFRLGTLFAPTAKDTYTFHFSGEMQAQLNTDNTDRACLNRGSISHSVLDYAQLVSTPEGHA